MLSARFVVGKPDRRFERLATGATGETIVFRGDEYRAVVIDAA